MKTRTILSLSLSALVLGGTMVGCTANGAHVAAASDRAAQRAARDAAKQASKAAQALQKRDAPVAIGYAEAAVGLAPRDVGYRMILADSYMSAGRFASARAAYGDVLQLTPDNGKAALNLALTQIAGGDWVSARATLGAHGNAIPAADLGLATALAGDPATAVAILTPVVRSGHSSPKARQNLALSYALAGEWQMARVVAATDMSPADVDARMEQWAAFAKPSSSMQQVAALLGVTPGPDAGQPVALALNAPVPVGAPMAQLPTQVAAADPVIPAPLPSPSPSPTVIAAATPAPVTAPTAASAPTPMKIAFAPRREIVQPLPAPMLRAAGPMKVAANVVVQNVPPVQRLARHGEWYVQLGAYSTVAVAKSGWAIATRKFAALSGHQPTGASFAGRQGQLYRLSVGGFSREAADSFCRGYRAKGGTCFIRRDAGDRMAQWLRTPVQMAAR